MPHPMGLQGVPHPQVKVLVHNAGFMSPGVCQDAMPDKKLQLVEKTDGPPALKPASSKPIAKTMPMDKLGNAATTKVATHLGLVKGEEIKVRVVDMEVVSSTAAARDMLVKPVRPSTKVLTKVPPLVPIAPAPPRCSTTTTTVAIAPRPAVATKVTAAPSQPPPPSLLQSPVARDKKVQDGKASRGSSSKAKLQPPTQMVLPRVSVAAVTTASHRLPCAVTTTSAMTAMVQPQLRTQLGPTRWPHPQMQLQLPRPRLSTQVFRSLDLSAVDLYTISNKFGLTLFLCMTKSGDFGFDVKTIPPEVILTYKH